jgi:threonine/homoserine/homoserine lactone efflux protein
MATQLLLDLIKGAIVGVVIALPLGPVGVLCVRRTLFEGPSYGFVSGLGAATADSLFGVIAGFGLTIVRDFLLGYQDWLGVGGGVFLLVVGIRALARAPEAELGPVGDEALFAAYVSTFALTITNPITILAFAAIFAQIGVSSGSGYLDTGLLVIGVFLGSLIWWLGLSFGIAALHRRLGFFNLAWLNRISGAVLALSGGGLLTAAGVALLRRVA